MYSPHLGCNAQTTTPVQKETKKKKKKTNNKLEKKMTRVNMPLAGCCPLHCINETICLTQTFAATAVAAAVAVYSDTALSTDLQKVSDPFCYLALRNAHSIRMHHNQTDSHFRCCFSYYSY